MKLEDQVCTFEQSLKLAELGVALPTTFYWSAKGKDRSDPAAFKLTIKEENDETADTCYSAFTTAELGILLPYELNLEDEDLYIQGTIGNRRGEFYYIWFQSSLDNVEWELFPAIERDTEAQARADALIWLIENEFVRVADLSI